jgi:hypothetical protein
MWYLRFKKKLAHNQDLIGTMEKALEHLKIKTKTLKSKDLNLVGTKTEEIGKTSLVSKII